MRKSLFVGLRRLFCVSITLLGLSVSDSVWAADPSTRAEARITVDIVEQPLAEAVATVAAIAGRPIELIGSVDDERRISVSLRDATLVESLERILYPSSHTIIWLNDGGLAVQVLADADDAPGAPRDSAARPEDAFDGPVSLFPGDDEVLPPSYPGAHGLTAADLEYYGSFRTPPTPNEDEVLPPRSPEGVGMSKEDLEFASQLRAAVSPHEVELLPPQGDAKFGLTAAEFEAIGSSESSLAPSQIEVLPADQPGGVGVTLEQLESMNRGKPSHLPLTLGDMIPPD